MPDRQLHFYINSDWDFKPPVVRIWVNGYLITERAITPQKKFNEYLEEIVVINFIVLILMLEILGIVLTTF